MIKYILNHRYFIYFNIFILFVLINAIAYGINLKWDLSRGDINSISESTEKVLRNLKYPLLIEAYISKDVPGQLIAQLQPIIYILEDIQRTGKDKISLKIINPSNQELQQLATKRGIQGIPIEEQSLDKASVRLGYFGVFIQYGDKSNTISLVEQGGLVSNFEYVFLKELKKLIVNNENNLSGIGYLKVQGSSEIRRWETRLDQNKDNLYAFKTFLEKEMGQWKEVDLKENVPDTVETLLVTGLPELTLEQQVYLDQFLLRGGNIVFMLKGFDFTISPPNPQYMQLGISSGSRGFTMIPEGVKKWNEFLAKYGLEIKERILLEPNLAVPEVDILGQYLGRYPNPSWALYSKEQDNILTNSELSNYLSYVIMPWFSDVSYNEKAQPQVKYYVLIQSSKKAVIKKETSLSLSDLQFALKDESEISNANLPVMLLLQGKFVSAFKENYKELNISKELKENFLTGQIGNTESKIIFIATPYLVSDIFFRNESNVEYFKINFAFVQNILEYLQGDTDLLAVRNKIPFVPILQIQLPKELQTIFSWIHTLSIPIVLGLYGLIRLKNRYRKKGVEQ